MTHDEALAALRENTHRFANHVIGWHEWDAEVERILRARYPSESAHQAARRSIQRELTRASHTSTPLDSRHLADALRSAADPAPAAARDAP